MMAAPPLGRLIGVAAHPARTEPMVTVLRTGRRWTGFAIIAMGLAVTCGQWIAMIAR